MTRPMTLVLAAFVPLLPGATAELRPLEGTWEGAHVGQESAGTITITFSGSSLHYEGLRADQRYDATFTLREGTRPRQLRATITRGGMANDIGRVIGAVFKIENGTLSLAGLEDDAPSTLADSEAFDGNTMFHYRFRRADPLAKKRGAPKKPEAPSSPAPWSPLKWPD